MAAQALVHLKITVPLDGRLSDLMIWIPYLPGMSEAQAQDAAVEAAKTLLKPGVVDWDNPVTYEIADTVTVVDLTTGQEWIITLS